jgi:hypothetical protein
MNARFLEGGVSDDFERREVEGHRHGAEHSANAVFNVQTPAAENKRNIGNVGLSKINIEVSQK